MGIKSRVNKIFWLGMMLSLTLFLFTPTIIYADNYAPNTTAVNETRAWRNVLETGDYLLVARYTVIYTTNFTPVTDISETFLFRLMDTTNTIELGVVEAYPYQNDGYGMGVVAWYFPASSAPVWGSPYWIRIEGKVTTFTTPPIYSYSIPATTYSVLTDQTAVGVDIGIKIRAMAQIIGASWSPVQVLTEEIDSGTVLSQAGEAYFRLAIPGIQSMAPTSFLYQVNDIPGDSTVWTNNLSNSSGGLVQNTTAGPGVSGIASIFNMSFSTTAAIPIVFACVVLVIVGAVQGNILSGLINSSFVLTGATLYGWFPMALLMLISFGAGVFVLYHILFKPG
jgi:hypothetical protein